MECTIFVDFIDAHVEDVGERQHWSTGTLHRHTAVLFRGKKEKSDMPLGLKLSIERMVTGISIQ
jgi:hypothetical protein